ncbi:SIR2 family protein [Helicobacter ailurogastricus]|nr:SIR2 family protein [Helicobacter ailurogastricus]
MTDNEYRSFIETSLENIRKAHNENYLSIFAGAGISTSAGLPSWDELMDILKKELYGSTKNYGDCSVLAEKLFNQFGLPSLENLVDFIKEVEKEIYDEIKKNGNYLILAEKFFNQFGKNFYYQTLKDKLKMPASSDTKLDNWHLEIVKLRVKNIITTNWDDLFEQTITKEGLAFDIIKKDADIGDSKGFPKLVKMHGSLEEKNIVFRDKDYLEYSQNFPLIENYVKGIFSTDVVVLIGYSLNDQNVRQIISWVNSCSDNVKPIYFIKTNDPFERIEFEFYKNKNIHILYLYELFNDKLDKDPERKRKERKRELDDFFKKIRRKEEHAKTLILDDEEIRYIDDILISFNFNKLEEKINDLKISKNITLKGKLLGYFLLFENRADDRGMPEFYPLYREMSKEAYINREFEIWFVSEFNKNWGFYSAESEHDEQDQDEWEEKFFRLPSSIKDKLKHFLLLENHFDGQLIDIYHSLMQALTSRSYWEHGGFSYDHGANLKNALQNLEEFDWIRIGNCLTIPRYDKHRAIYTRALECFWCEISISVLSAKNAKKETPLLLVDKKVFSYSVRYFQTKELEEIFQRYFADLTLRIKVNEEFLGEIFTNICSKFKQYGAFTTRSSRWFDNFLFLASHCLLKQSTFERIVEEVNHKIQERVTSLDQYGQLKKFILEQSKNDALSLQHCSDLVRSYLSLFVESKAGGYEIEARSIFSKIVEKIKIVGEEYKNLITGFLEKVHQYILVTDSSNFSFADLLASNPDLQEDLKAIINSDEVQYKKTFLPFIKVLYRSSDENLKKAIKEKLQYILDHKDNYAQTNASAKYCQWLKEFIEGLSR